MILLIDIGNTRFKWLLKDDRNELSRGFLNHREVDPFSHHSWASLPQPQRIMVSSVAGLQLDRQLTDWCRKHWQRAPEFIHSSARDLGITNGYHNPGKMGNDRWLAMAGAWHLDLAPCCIADCGTAITIDALNKGGQHLGGIILPGMGLMRKALLGNTARIDANHVDDKATVFGKSTSECVNGGIVHGTAAALENIARQMGQTMGATNCVICGGDAERLLSYLPNHWKMEKDLIFHGLWMAFKRA